MQNVSDKGLACKRIKNSYNSLMRVWLLVSDSVRPHKLQPARLLCPWDSPGKNTEVGCHFLLQEIFLTQGSNPCLLHLLHWQADSLPLCHLESPITTWFIGTFHFITRHPHNIIKMCTQGLRLNKIDIFYCFIMTFLK